jgi:hypothetical protein
VGGARAGGGPAQACRSRVPGPATAFQFGSERPGTAADEPPWRGKQQATNARFALRER